MRAVLALVAFGFVGTVSPGPNNAILWASGTRFGLARTVPHVLGTVAGMAALVGAVAAGLGTLVHAVPAVDLALRIAGSGYMLYLAYLVAGAGAAGRAQIARPLTAPEAAAFQWLNPKAWIFALAVVATFAVSTASSSSVRPVLLLPIVSIIVLASSSIWAAGGAALGRLIERDRARRVTNVVLAVLLVASVALLWI